MQLERVVVGVDFSAPSLAAARWTARHFARGEEVVLVHSIEIPEPPGFLRALAPPDEELARTTREGAGRRLRALGESLAAARVRTEVREGRPADRIAEVAEALDADLIVVGEHGHRGGLDHLLGSTAEQLVRSAPVPVLLARGLPEGEPRSILLPVDESELMRPALRWGRALAERFDVRPRALYAVSPMLAGRMRIVSSAAKEEELEAKLLRDAARWLEERLAEAGFAPGSADASVVIADPGHEIVESARRQDTDLIVMASRGSGGIGEALIGSVARTVLRGATCPVLVVNQPGE